MRRWLLNTVLALPQFRGRGRLLNLVRNGCFRPYERTIDGSLRMELDVFEWTQLTLASGGFTEPKTIALIKRLLAPGDVFVDVGAHVGTMGLVARQQIGPTGKVIAIEPQPYNCQHILRNWEINGFDNLKLIVAAAGSQCGTITLPQQAATDKARLSLVLPMPDALPLTYTVPMTTLEAVLEQEQVSSVKLLKIDVEGFELEVLRGLEPMRDRVENIVFEALNSSDEASDPNAASGRNIAEWLQRYGFQTSTVEGTPWTGVLPVPENNLWAHRHPQVSKDNAEN